MAENNQVREVRSTGIVGRLRDLRNTIALNAGKPVCISKFQEHKAEAERLFALSNGLDVIRRAESIKEFQAIKNQLIAFTKGTVKITEKIDPFKAAQIQRREETAKEIISGKTYKGFRAVDNVKRFQIITAKGEKLEIIKRK